MTEVDVIQMFSQDQIDFIIFYEMEIISESDSFIIEKIDHLMQIRQDNDYVNLLDAEARNNTWEARVNEILTTLNGDE